MTSFGTLKLSVHLVVVPNLREHFSATAPSPRRQYQLRPGFSKPPGPPLAMLTSRLQSAMQEKAKGF